MHLRLTSKTLRAVAIAGLAIFAVRAGGSTSSVEQFGFVDLTRPPETSKPIGDGPKESLLGGCEKLTGGMIGDGAINPENGQPRDIDVEITKLDTATPTVGSEIQAELQLRNAGTLDIQIPWSTDPATIKSGQGPLAYEWEQGTFELELKNVRGDGILLTTFIRSLYSSKYAPRSELSLPPGGYVTARVKFKFEDQFPSVRRVDLGTWQLSSRWEQVRRQWFAANCSVTNGYFRYDSYYRQKTPGVTIQILPSGF